MNHLFIIKIESYEGDDTYLRCGDDTQDYLYCVVETDAFGQAEVVDRGYRTYCEALAAWPEAATGPRQPASG